MNREKIIELLHELNAIATGYDVYEFGLPTHCEVQMDIMVQAVEKFLDNKPS
jgi:hypothetical protein